MQGRYFADQAVKFSQVPAFRAEHFPYAGPYPWLDLPDALDRIDEKLQLGELTAEEAEQCRCWSQNGYIILPKLVDDLTLDTVWSAYEKAIASGRIRASPCLHSITILMLFRDVDQYNSVVVAVFVPMVLCSNCGWA